jgi:hypothetical protein
LPLSAAQRRGLGLLAALAALAIPGLAAAYLLPAKGVFRRLADVRENLSLHTFEVRGTLTATGEVAAQLSTATGLPLSSSGGFNTAALITVKTPGKCKLELTAPEQGEADRASVTSKNGKITGVRALETLPAAEALITHLCSVLGHKLGGADPERVILQAAQKLGVALETVSLGRFDGRIAYVVGAQPFEKERPQIWVDKATYQPARVIAQSGGLMVDTRLVGFGSPIGGDWFPRLIEVQAPPDTRLRFLTEKVAANPKVSDAIF